MPPKPVPIFSQPATIIPSRPNDQHDIATTLAFVDTLDTLPGELTKTFGDLRELDAVLNSTTTNITHKLRALTEALEGINRNIIPVKIDGIARNYDGNNTENAFPQADGTRSDIAPRDMDQQLERQSPYARPLDRFQLLLEIAEELTRYKIGVEDKVRVSGQACDTMIAQQAHLRALLANSSVLLASPLAISSDRSKMHGDTSHNRRQRVSPSRVGVDNTFTSGNGGSDQETLSHTTREHDLGYNAADVTPSKRRKTGKEKSASGMDFWDAEETSARLGSPALAKQPVAGTSATQLYKDKKNAPKRRSRNSPAGSIREGPTHSRLVKPDVLQVGLDSGDYPHTAEARHLGGSSGPTTHVHHGEASEPKYPEGIYPSVNVRSMHNSAKGTLNTSHSKIQLSDRGSSRAIARREGMENLDTQPIASFNDATEVDLDPTPYCYCQKQSYGEMIGCDSDDCRYEWFHLSCLNLSQPPDGTWLCPECEAREHKEKRSKSKKSGPGGKVARKRM